jgi:hypothetical protein
MDELELLNGVYMAAYDTYGGKQNVENRDKRLKLLTKRSKCYEEWELFCIENDQAVRCICGMPATIGRSAILKSTIDELFIYVGSNCIRQFPNVTLSLTKDGYSREDNFVVDDNLSTSSDEDFSDIETSSEDSRQGKGNYLNDSSVQQKVHEACADFFSRKMHTEIEKIVFLGYLKSLY